MKKTLVACLKFISVHKLDRLKKMTGNNPDLQPHSATSPGGQTAILEKLLNTMMDDTRRRERAQRRDAWIKGALIGTLVLASIGSYAYFLRGVLFPGDSKTDGPTMAVVQVRGAIMPDSKTTSGGLVSAAIMEAAKDENVKKIVLYIESPGGAPVEAERIAQTVQVARDVHKKPVVAVIGNLGASAGYMVALSADEIISGKYSLVGSIGAVIQSWQVAGLLERLDVKARSYTSGDLKAMLSPFEPGTPKADAKAQELVDVVGAQFATLVSDRRKGKLTQPIEVYTTGEIWNGEQALKLGLVDANGTLESVAAEQPDLEVVSFGPDEKKGLMGALVGAVQEGVRLGVQALAEPAQILVR